MLRAAWWRELRTPEATPGVRRAPRSSSVQPIAPATSSSVIATTAHMRWTHTPPREDAGAVSVGTSLRLVFERGCFGASLPFAAEAFPASDVPSKTDGVLVSSGASESVVVLRVVSSGSLTLLVGRESAIRPPGASDRRQGWRRRDNALCPCRPCVWRGLPREGEVRRRRSSRCRVRLRRGRLQDRRAARSAARTIKIGCGGLRDEQGLQIFSAVRTAWRVGSDLDVSPAMRASYFLHGIPSGK